MPSKPAYGSTEYGELLASVTRRDGPVDACHVVQKQAIKRTFSRGAFRLPDGRLRALRPREVEWSIPGDCVAYVEPSVVTAKALRDERNVIAGFRRSFHGPFDARHFKLPPSMLPVGFNDFVDEYGLHVEAEARVDAKFFSPEAKNAA